MEYGFIHHNEDLIEHLTDHLYIAFSFFLLGMLVFSYIAFKLFQKRVRIDYNMPQGIMMRMFVNGRKYFVIRPSSINEFYDVVILSIYDKGKERIIDNHDRKRVRIIRYTVLVLIYVSILTGTLLVLSALQVDMNPFNRIKGHDAFNLKSIIDEVFGSNSGQ
jgi:hypothetical protein